MNLTAALLVVLAGLAVGPTSIGGILVAPTLTSVAGVAVHTAIAAANFSFLFTGAASAVNLLSGQLELRTGLILGGLLMLGWSAGRMFARRVPIAALRRMLAFWLVAVGLGYGWQTFQETYK